MSFISKVFHLNRTSCPRFPSHPNRTPLKISLSRLFAQEKKTTDAQKQTLKPSAAVGKHQLILEKGDDFLAAGLIPLKVEIIVLASKLRKKVVQRESIWIGTNCLYQNLASFKPLLLFTGGTFLVKLQNSSPPPPHQKKNENNPQNCSSPSAARPRSFGCCQRERRRLGVSTRPTTGGRMSFQKVFPPGKATVFLLEV